VFDVMNDHEREFSHAKTLSFRYLKIRERSVGEMREKLTLKRVPKSVIDLTVEYLVNKKFLDDRTFTRNWIRYRQARPFGAQRIRLELRQKGIDEEIIAEELSSAFDGTDQSELLRDLASRRASRYKDDDPIKRKRKVFDFLVRRGFNLDVIKRAIKNI
jgi:regulatory protein